MWLSKKMKDHFEKYFNNVNQMREQVDKQALELRNQREELNKLTKYVKSPALQLDRIKKAIFDFVRQHPTKVKEVCQELESCVATLKKQEAQGELPAPPDKIDLSAKLDILLTKLLSEDEIKNLQDKNEFEFPM